MQSTKAKRTNSLAFCKTDCHTCASLGQRCDRRRPQCSTCLSNGRKCGGFATPLVWDERRMFADSPVDGVSGENAEQTIPAKTPPKSPSRRASPSRTGASRRFRFVMGPSRARKRRKTCPPQVEDPPLPDVQDNVETAEGGIQFDNDQTSNFLDNFGMYFPMRI